MAVKIDIKHSNVAGVVPTTSSINLNEIAFNTADGKAYFKRYSNTGSIAEFIATPHSGSFVLFGSQTITGSLTVLSGSSSVMGTKTYEPLVVEKSGDLKLGVYTTVNNFTSGGAAIALGYNNITASSNFINYYYPGFEMQMVGNITESQNRLRFNYLQRNTTGVVVASSQELLNIYPDARVTLAPTAVGAVPRLIIGATSSIYNLDVSGSANISNGLTVTGSMLIADTANSNTNFIGGLATFQSNTVNNVRVLYTNASKPAAGGPTFILAAPNFQIPLIQADNTPSSSTYSPGFEIQEWLENTETDTRLRINYVRIKTDGTYLQNSGHEDLISIFPSGRIRINPTGSRPWGGGGGLYEAGLSIGTNASSSTLEVSGSTNINGSLTVTGSTTITDVLVLPFQNPLPSNKPTSSIALSGSGGTFEGMYVYNGTSWIKV